VTQVEVMAAEVLLSQEYIAFKNRGEKKIVKQLFYFVITVYFTILLFLLSTVGYLSSNKCCLVYS